MVGRRGRRSAGVCSWKRSVLCPLEKGSILRRQAAPLERMICNAGTRRGKYDAARCNLSHRRSAVPTRLPEGRAGRQWLVGVVQATSRYLYGLPPEQLQLRSQMAIPFQHHARLMKSALLSKVAFNLTTQLFNQVQSRRKQFSDLSCNDDSDSATY